MNIHEKIKELTNFSDADIIAAMRKMTLQQYVTIFSAIAKDDVSTILQIFSELPN